MVKRLNITVPDELSERLEPLRERMNISRICATAIEREVKALEAVPQEVQDLATLIARLRNEKVESEQQDRKQGFEQGVIYAQQSNYAELMIYADVAAEAKAWRHGDYDFDLPDGVLDDMREAMQDSLVIDALTYKQGWLEGMMAVWKKIKKAL